MLKAVGIISEYNPFHNGHAYQLAQAKKKTGADVTIAIMSGNWLQRGEPAIYDKWLRANAALKSGVDVVIELPVYSAVQPSHIFSMGAVKLAAAIKCQWLAFGAETPGIDYQLLIKNQPRKDRSFKRFDRPYASMFQDYLYQKTGIRLNQPNDVLAFGYANANAKLGFPLELIPIKRIGSDHNASQLTSGEIASASAIRNELYRGRFEAVQRVVPEATQQLISSGTRISWGQFWPLLRFELIEAPINQLQTVYQMTEGIEYRLKQAAIEAETFSKFLHLVKTKRYTYTRIQRLCCYVLLHATTANMLTDPKYIRLLGCTSQGRQYLNQVKADLPLPMISKVNQDVVKDFIELDFKAGMLIEMMTGAHQDFYKHPIILK
ncbi:nucleotidyltransferase [Lentilactobacillus raoultii]|uniref:tRNA(Met) cytidine acetate ligase n=1 Tax=Lentilactobacillus raoultii TaxID=1987503 RepID=A0ABW3PQZ5_9LACO|nr:nucleotidyltransferase [Lentilactobacillus raoultii]